jgi:hypothetical protein
LFELFFAHRTKELSRITAMSKPAFLLPPRKPRCSKRHFVRYFPRNGFPFASTDAFSVSKLKPEFLMRRAIGDAPRADYFKIVHSVRHTLIRESSGSFADFAHSVRGAMLPVSKGAGWYLNRGRSIYQRHIQIASKFTLDTATGDDESKGDVTLEVTKIN